MFTGAVRRVMNGDCMQISNPQTGLREKGAFEIAQELAARGYKALYAGGYVRDMVRGAPGKGDVDIATDARPNDIAKMFSQVKAVGAHFGVMLVMRYGIAFEVATFRSDIGCSDGRHPDQVEFTNAREDARRRDFTINGLFYDPMTEQVIDYVHGMDDLQAEIVRAIGNPARRFQEDYLRLLRAVRFAASLGFTIEPATWKAMCQSARGIERIAAERVFIELDKMIRAAGADRALLLLQQSGILQYVLPELAETVDIPQPKQFHPEGTVFMHTVKAISYLDQPSQVCAWATLLHDIGKVDTLTYADRIRFNNHARVGARKARYVLRRLRAPRYLIDAVYTCIDNHMHFIDVQRMKLSNLKKFLARSTIDDELELHRVDCLSSHGNCDNLDYLQQKREEIGREAVKPAPFIKGRDLLALGFSPGPTLGRILDEVYELQLEERVTTRDEALAWVRQHYLPPQRDPHTT